MEYPARIALRNILYPTDLSRWSDAVLPFAKSLARAHNAKLHALHVLVADTVAYMTSDYWAAAIERQEQAAIKKMWRIEEQLHDVAHSIGVTKAADMWSGVEAQIQKCEIDLIVLGTRGRTGLKRLVLGSGAEQILRKSTVPVMVVGPFHGDAIGEGSFQRVVFPSDFTPQSLAAFPYAVAVAQEEHAALTLLHVIEKEGKARRAQRDGLSIAEALHRLRDIVPPEMEIHSRPEALVEHGKPAERILETAKGKNADLIVLGVRGDGGLFAATHLENTAHRVISRSACPVMTICAPAA